MSFDEKPFPKVLVFDLDFTLWPFWVDTHVAEPLQAEDGGKTVKDGKGASYSFYPEVPHILQDLRREGIAVGIASSTAAPELAREMLELLVLEPAGKSAMKFLDSVQIIPGSKAIHVTKLQKQMNVAYEDMIFFDDEPRNKNVETELGVYTYIVRDGLTSEVIEHAVEEWRRRRGFE